MRHCYEVLFRDYTPIVERVKYLGAIQTFHTEHRAGMFLCSDRSEDSCLWVQATPCNAALTGGSALGVRVQLRALFVSGGVLVLIVCC
jgi:hypothetical protein